MTMQAFQPVSDDKRKLEILLKISRSLGEEIHLDRLLAVMVAEVTEAMEAERSSLLLYDEPTGELLSRVAEGLQSREIRVPMGVGIAGMTAQTRSTINIPDAYRDPRFNPAFDKKTGFVTRSVLSSPIVNQRNRLIGVVQVLNKTSGEAFTSEDEEFLRAICIHLALALERAELVNSYVESQKLQQSLQLAHDIQMGLVPKKFPAFPDRPEIDIFATIKPALDVGGDLYDFFLLDHDRLCFVIGDVSDKGVPAALFMAMVRTAFKISAMAAPDSIAFTLRTVNRFLAESNESQMFVTALAGVLDLRSGTIVYSDGGHEPPFIKRFKGAVEMVEKKQGMALGVMDDYAFESGTMQLQPGDSLLLYTDGVNEAMNMSNQMFKTPTIGQTIAGLPDRTSAEEIAKTLVGKVSEWVGAAPQSDDITVLAIRYCGR
jgi:serine phosphatase RsbU (regulator of sigma subunit)